MASLQSVAAARARIKVSTSAQGGRTLYNVTFPHPTSGSPVTVSFKDNVKSRYAKYSNGISYIGICKVDPIPLSVFQSVGLTPSQAKALKHISKNEGNFDAINSYDKAIFSWGFIQFAGGAGGSLGSLLLTIKKSEPAVFDQMFGQFGIDVYPSGVRGIVRVMADNGSMLDDAAGWTYIKDSKQLTAVFTRAAFHPTIMVKQIEQAAKGYAVPALKKINISLDFNGQHFNLSPITDVIRSEAGSTSLIDITVNQWINKAGMWFKEAMEQVATREGIRSYDQLRAIDERKVLEQIVVNAQSRDGRIAKRTGKILHSDLSFNK